MIDFAAKRLTLDEIQVASDAALEAGWTRDEGANVGPNALAFDAPSGLMLVTLAPWGAHAWSTSAGRAALGSRGVGGPLALDASRLCRPEMWCALAARYAPDGKAAR